MGVQIDVKTDVHGSPEKLKAVKTELHGMKDAAAKSGEVLKGVWKQVAGGILAATGLQMSIRGLINETKALVGSFMSVAVQAERYKAQLKVLLGSQEAANQAFLYFRDIAAKLPFTLEEVVESGTRLATIKAPFEKWLPRIADLAAAMGIDLPTATDQMSRAMTEGLGSAILFHHKGINSLIEAFAKEKKGIDDISKVSLPKLREVLYEFTGQFAGASEEMERTWSGIVLSLQNKWYQFRSAVMESAVFESLKTGLAEFNKKLDEFVESGKMAEWANQTAQAILKAFKAIIQGVQWMIAGINILKAAWYTALEEITKLIMRFQEKQILAFGLLSEIFPSFRDDTKKLIEQYIELVDQLDKYKKGNVDATDAAADMITKFDDIVGWLDEIIASNKEATEETKKYSSGLDGLKESAKGVIERIKIFDELERSKLHLALITGQIDLKHYTEAMDALKNGVYSVYQQIQKLEPSELSDIIDPYFEKLESVTGTIVRIFASIGAIGRPVARALAQFEKDYVEPLKKDIFDIYEFWKDVNQQIEAEWIRGISSLITHFKSFGDSLKTIMGNFLKIFGDMVGMMVVKWAEGMITMKVALEGLKRSLWALAAYVATSWVQQFLTAIGIISDAADELADAWLKKWREGIKHESTGTRITPEEKEARDIIEAYKELIGDIPKDLLSLITGARTINMLRNVSRITSAVIELMIAQGKSLYETLTALKEPLMMLKEKYGSMVTETVRWGNMIVGVTAKVPKYLQGIFGVLEQMEARPKLFERMDALMNIFKLFRETGAMTQGMFIDLADGAKSFARQILGVTGNLRAAIGDLDSLTREQILMLAPLLMPFLQAAQEFGLKLPGWITDLAEKAGIKITEQPIAKVPGKLDIIARRIDDGVLRVIIAIRELGKSIGIAIGNVGGQGGLDFMSGSRGGIVRYHPYERITVQPQSLPPISIQVTARQQKTPIIIMAPSGQVLAELAAPYIPSLSAQGRWKMHERGLTDRR